MCKVCTREIVIVSPLMLLWRLSKALTLYYIGIGIQQNNHSPLPSSTIHWPSRNDGMTRTPLDSVQLARGNAQMNRLQLNYLRSPSFVGFSKYPSEAPDGQCGNAGHGGMHSSSSLERGGFKIAIVSRTLLIC